MQCIWCNKKVKPIEKRIGCMIDFVCPKCGEVIDSKPDGSVSIDEYMKINNID